MGSCAFPEETQLHTISARDCISNFFHHQPGQYSFPGSCYPFPEWPFPLLLLLFLVFSLARPNKKELLQKESFLSEALLLLVFPSVFPRSAQQERITLKKKRSAALPLPRPSGPLPPRVGNRISYYQPGSPDPPPYRLEN